jgi:soluble epoxide hydrolase / lipid-phosphate phosphatase
MTGEVTEHVFDSNRHKSFYLASGPEDGPMLLFIHGWPELSLSWRAQLPALGALGFRVIAPDMRGYGRSSVPDTHDAYTLENIVADMIELVDHLGADKVVWIGHDWGSPVAWSLAAHHPDRTAAVASLCIPYRLGLEGLEALAALIDRDIYPIDEYPAGQWDYMLHYQEDFAGATAEMEVSPYNTIVALFRAADPDGANEPAMTAAIRKNGGWFPGMNGAPAMPVDETVVSPEDALIYGGLLTKNGFFGPNSYYMNTAANTEYTTRAANGGRLDMPALFVHAAYDYVAKTLDSRLADPMRALCPNLEEATVYSSHWMAQEKPVQLNGVLASWLAREVGDHWPS